MNRNIKKTISLGLMAFVVSLIAPVHADVPEFYQPPFLEGADPKPDSEHGLDFSFSVPWGVTYCSWEFEKRAEVVIALSEARLGKWALLDQKVCKKADKWGHIIEELHQTFLSEANECLTVFEVGSNGQSFIAKTKELLISHDQCGDVEQWECGLLRGGPSQSRPASWGGSRHPVAEVCRDLKN